MYLATRVATEKEYTKINTQKMVYISQNKMLENAHVSYRLTEKQNNETTTAEQTENKKTKWKY